MLDIIKPLIPLLTFLMGVGFTLWIKKGERRRELSEKYAIELAEAMNAWHQRLYDLRALSLKGNENEFKNHAIDYEQNRHELPKIIRSLEVLRTDPAAEDIVKIGDEFLEMFTKENDIGMYYYAKTCVSSFNSETNRHRSRICGVSGSGNSKLLGYILAASNSDTKLTDFPSPSQLRRSDELLQRANYEAGRMHVRRRR